MLSDGGVYDNLGLETADDFAVLLVSDAGGPFKEKTRVPSLWLLQILRVLDTIDHQVRALRKRRTFEREALLPNNVGFWGIRTLLQEYPAAGKLPVDQPRANELGSLSTRLAALTDEIQERLINWGYAVSDAALRSFVAKNAAPPTGFPYPGGV